MRESWRHAIGALLVTAVSVGPIASQTPEREEESPGNVKVECDAFTLEGLAPGMRFTDVAKLLKAKRPKPRPERKHRNYNPESGWQAVHRWQVEAGTLEVWYDAGEANRKTDPTAIRVRLLVPEDSMTVEEVWKAVFDRFGPMSDWEREDCDVTAEVGMEKNRPVMSLTLLSWARASNPEED